MAIEIQWNVTTEQVQAAAAEARKHSREFAMVWPEGKKSAGYILGLNWQQRATGVALTAAEGMPIIAALQHQGFRIDA